MCFPNLRFHCGTVKVNSFKMEKIKVIKENEKVNLRTNVHKKTLFNIATMVEELRIYSRSVKVINEMKYLDRNYNKQRRWSTINDQVTCGLTVLHKMG